MRCSLRVLGIDYPQFLQLLEQAELAHAQRQGEREAQKIRVNAKGGGRKTILSVAEEVCLCLLYLRHYPTFEILGLQFGVSKTEANDTVHYWLSILRVLLPASLLEAVASEDSDYAMVQEWLSQFQLIVDSLEQARERPEDNQEQRSYFSGKKQQHTFKSQLVTLPVGKDIADVTAGVKGPTGEGFNGYVSWLSPLWFKSSNYKKVVMTLTKRPVLFFPNVNSSV